MVTYRQNVGDHSYTAVKGLNKKDSMRLLSSPSSRNFLLKSDRGSPNLQFLSANNDSRINLNIIAGEDNTGGRTKPFMSPRTDTRAMRLHDKSINQVYSPERM